MACRPAWDPRISAAASAAHGHAVHLSPRRRAPGQGSTARQPGSSITVHRPSAGGRDLRRPFWLLLRVRGTLRRGQPGTRRPERAVRGARAGTGQAAGWQRVVRRAGTGALGPWLLALPMSACRSPPLPAGWVVRSPSPPPGTLPGNPFRLDGHVRNLAKFWRNNTST